MLKSLGKRILSAVYKEPLVVANDKIKIYRYTVSEFDKAFGFCNWKNNRPPDDVRVKDIRTFLDSSDTSLVPGIIYAWKDVQGSGRQKPTLKIYDGIHRLLAAKSSPYDRDLLLSIYETDNEDEIVKDFCNLNKSINVPHLYLENGDMVKRHVCEQVAKSLCERYPTFVSPSRKPFVYNFNRDVFIEFLSELEIDFGQKNVDAKIFQELLGLNHQAKEFCVRNKVKTPRKCEFHDFYLFYLSKELIKIKLQDALNK